MKIKVSYAKMKQDELILLATDKHDDFRVVQKQLIEFNSREGYCTFYIILSCVRSTKFYRMKVMEDKDGIEPLCKSLRRVYQKKREFLTYI